MSTDHVSLADRAKHVSAADSLVDFSQAANPTPAAAGDADASPVAAADASGLDQALRKHNIPRWTVIGLLCLTALIVMSVSLYWLSAYSRARADAWITDSSSEPLRIPQSTSEQEAAERMQAQLSDARAASTFHLQLIKDFMRYQFVLTTLATFSAAIAALLLFPVSWNGLQKANSYLVTMFLVSTAVAIGATTLTQVYRLQENVDENKRLYLAYRVLEDEIRSFYPARQSCVGSISENMKQLCETSPAAFIRAIDKRIGDIRSLAVAFDPSRTPTVQDVFKQVSAAAQEAGG